MRLRMVALASGAGALILFGVALYRARATAERPEPARAVAPAAKPDPGQ